jgi:chromate transporter
VVALAIWGMAKNLPPDRERAGNALAGIAIMVFIGGSLGQIGAIALGAIAGVCLCRGEPSKPTGISRRGGAIALISRVVMLTRLDEWRLAP